MSRTAPSLPGWCRERQPARPRRGAEHSLWACLFDQLDGGAGTHIVHVGAGLGYYTAILAEIVGKVGHVTAVEIDPGLAEQARQNLAPWSQAMALTADGFTFRPERPADAVIVNAGVSHLSLTWLDCLTPEIGRLLVPLTNAAGWGAFLLITRATAGAPRYSATFVCRTGIFACAGGRDPMAEARLVTALQRARFSAIQSLRRAPEEPDDTCWLAGDGWWLSTASYLGTHA